MSDSPNNNPPAKPAGTGASFSMGGSVSGGQSYGGAASASYSQSAAPVQAHAAAPAPGGDATGALVKDISTQSFVEDVIEASKNGPVLVDFWAPWCGPCKQLGPVIEKVVSQAKGAVTLCKMDIDQHPDVSRQMGIQSIPAVVAFVDGRPAEAFMGAKSETEVRAFVDKLVADNPTPQMADMSAALDEADKLSANGSPAEAAEIYSSILAREPGNLDALGGLGQCFLAVGEVEQAKGLLESVPEEHHGKGALAALSKALELAQQASELGDVSGLQAAVDANPKDHGARYDLAIALAANGRKSEAVDHLIVIVKADRKWNEDGARAKLVEFFEAWGNLDEATISGRRALSSVLFS